MAADRADGVSSVAVASAAAAAALEAPDVAALHGGAVGEIATYGGGVRVKGIRVHERPLRRIGLHVIARFGARLDDLAEDVRRRVRDALRTAAPEYAAAAIDIHVVDVTTDDAVRPHSIEEPVRWR
jgi:uncharacterized alkaline shock family protein YloU